MKRKILISILLFISGILLLIFTRDLLIYYIMGNLEEMSVGVDMIKVDAGPINVELGNDTEWATIFKMLLTVLGTYLGIKLINKYIK